MDRTQVTFRWSSNIRSSAWLAYVIYSCALESVRLSGYVSLRIRGLDLGIPDFKTPCLHRNYFENTEFSGKLNVLTDPRVVMLP